MAQDKDFEVLVLRCFGRHRQQIDKAGENKRKGSEEHGRVRREKTALYAAVSDNCPVDAIFAPYGLLCKLANAVYRPRLDNPL